MARRPGPRRGRRRRHRKAFPASPRSSRSPAARAASANPTVAVNLALGLARLGLKTGLLDADIYGPSVPRLLGITQKPDSDGKKLKPIEKFGLKTMSIGFLVGDDEAMIWRGPMVQSALTQMMGDVAWAPLDVLVLDMPPGTGDAQLTIAQRVPLRGAVIVSTPQDIALIDARKGIAMFRKTQVPNPGYRREYERLHLSGLRPCPSYLRPWRRAPDRRDIGGAVFSARFRWCRASARHPMRARR